MPKRLHQIQRTEQAVKASQNSDMVLRKIHRGFVQRLHFKAGVDVTGEGVDGRTSVICGERHLEYGEPLRRQLSKLVRYMHELSEPGLGQPGRRVGQRLDRKSTRLNSCH